MKQLFFIVLLSQLLLAAPAYSGKRTFTQPDGTTVTYRMKGDEYLHWLESDEGEILLNNETARRLEYATIKNGHLKASGLAYSKKHRTVNTSKKSATFKKVSKEELMEIYSIKRNMNRSKMPSRHKAHSATSNR